MSENNIIPNTTEKESPAEGSKGTQWAEFIETSVIDFFSAHKLEKISVEDGNGNKAKLSKTKDNDVKVEYSTTKIM